MKKRFLIILMAAVVALGISAFIAACVDTAPPANYSVFVLSPEPDEDPIPDVTVSWMNGSSVAGTATTDANGRAEISLPAGTYTVKLSGIGEGYEYDSVSVTSTMRNTAITLSAKRVEYSVTVIDKNGTPASGVNVNWMNGTALAGSATTNAQGKASKELNYGEYSVTLSNLPASNIYDGAKTVYGNNPSLQFTLVDGVSVGYKVTVHSEGGLIFKNQDIGVYRDAKLIDSGKTDDNGVYTFSAPALTYKVSATNLQAGYSCKPLQLTGSNREGELVLHSEVITTAPAANTTYVMGDIIHDYTFTTPYKLNGQIWSSSVSQILQNKEALIINNWGMNCSNCIIEMPEMQEVYEKYSERIELVAVSNYVPRDTDEVISNYYASKQYTFPMMRDVNGFTTKFGITGWPTTVIIDRYGAIARIEVGAITSAEAWERMILKYIGNEYEQTFTPGDRVSESINTEVAKPDIVLPADHYDKIAQTIGAGLNITWFGEDDEEQLAWPFLLDTDETVSPEEKVLYASNTGKANSWAVLYATVTLKPGKVFTFDYYSDTQEGGDILNVIWEGRVIKEISGNSNGWKTCYLYSEFFEGTYRLAFVYQKDGSVNTGLDNVYLRNVRFVDEAGITEPTDMLRPAAFGGLNEAKTKFNYYADVKLGADGFYHVDATKMHFTGTDYTATAGNDDSPLLLVNLFDATPWSPVNPVTKQAYSITQLVVGRDENDEYAIDCTFTINGVTRDYREDLVEYLSAALASDVPGYAPVNAFLHDMLVQFMAKVSGENSHTDEWLEACYFYAHYGTGDTVGNPIIGLLPATATPVTAGTLYTADLTRNQAPFPSWIYTFTPDESAVYKIESFIPDDAKGEYAMVWLYDDSGDPDNCIAYSGETHVTLGGVNEQNFELYRYLEQGHKYYIEVAFQMSGVGQLDFKITNVGQSASEWTTCSADLYDMVLDENENVLGIVLAGAIEYELVDGYYHAKNNDGTTGDIIYLDILNATSSALGNIPLNRLIDAYCSDPADYSKLDYKVFDFRYVVKYFNTTDSSGNAITTYNPKVNISNLSTDYIDYTEILRQRFAQAPSSGEYKGLIPVDEELVKILSLFFKLRNNGIYDDVFEEALPNEWLRFCWYKRVHNATNP